MRYSDRLAHIRGFTPKRLPSGELWATTGHPGRKDIEAYC